MAAKNTTKKSYSRCICGLCQRDVLGNFAQGHDAKLVSVASTYVVGNGITGHNNEVPADHWLAPFGATQEADIEDRIRGAYAEFTKRTSFALADKFDRAVRNRWAATASKATRAAAKAERREQHASTKALRGAQRAGELMAKLEASGKALHMVETTPAAPVEPKLVRPIQVAATCGTCGAKADEPCTRKDGRRMPSGRRHEDHA